MLTNKIVVKLNRKTFIQKTVGAAILTVPFYSLMSCSNDDNTDVPSIDHPDAFDCLANVASAAAISSNHGHTLSVSKTDIDVGTEKSYTIQGSSDHSHTIVLTVASFNTLKSAKTLRIESSLDDSHRHDVTVTCA